MYDSVISLLKDTGTPASVLLTIALDEYGPECIDWEPEVLKLEILSDFGVGLSDTQSDKLQAAIIIFSSDQFEWDWHTFNNCILALNGEPFDYEELYPIDTEQIVAAMPEVEMIKNDFQEGNFKFSDEVNTYAGFIFAEYGLFSAPDEFPSAHIPSLQGVHNSDSQVEKKEALAEVYSAKKEKLKEYMDCLHHVFTV